MKVFLRKLLRIALTAVLPALLSIAGSNALRAQDAAPSSAETELAQVPLPEPSADALPLPEDRGAADLEQTLKRLGTTASVLFIVAHPDDEDGALMTYLSRGLGVRVTLLTLTRGEGGQNALGAESYDALGLIRTNELLKADQYYGVRQLWGTEADFGFSKTQEEAFSKWGHDRVLYDAVLAVRMVRPQVILSTFVGGVSDGHGHHQVSGEIAQEAFKAAADPKVFPEQLKNGLEPWQPLAVYSRTPFAPITNGQMLDYATGKWAPARFHNYVTGEWIEGSLPADVTLPVGTWDPILGRTYVQIAREGWGEQKSQYGGADPALSGPDSSSYHLWAAAPSAATSGENKPAAEAGTDRETASLFWNAKVHIDTGITGLARLAGSAPPQWLTDGLSKIESDLNAFTSDCKNQSGLFAAHKLVPIYRETLDLYARVKASDLNAEAKADLEFELSRKSIIFKLRLKTCSASTSSRSQPAAVAGRASAVAAHLPTNPRAAFGRARSSACACMSPMRSGARSLAGSGLGAVTARRGRSTTPAVRPIQIKLTHTKQLHRRATSTFMCMFPPMPRPPRPTSRVPPPSSPSTTSRTKPGASAPSRPIRSPPGRSSPSTAFPSASAWSFKRWRASQASAASISRWWSRPPSACAFSREARILPLDGSPLPVNVTVHAEHAADGVVDLKLPEGWRADPAQREFHLNTAGDAEPLVFSVSPAGDVAARAYAIKAVAHVGDQSYSIGWQSIGYHRPAAL